MVLPSRCLPGPAQRQQLVEPLACKAHVSLGCLPRSLLERVEHVHSFGELGDVHDSMLQSRVYSDFADAGSDSRHRFPVKRLQALLDPPGLEASESPGVSRERSHIVPARGSPLKRLIRHGALYKYQYIQSTRNRDASHNYCVHLAAGVAPTSSEGWWRSPAAGDAERCADATACRAPLRAAAQPPPRWAPRRKLWERLQ